MTIEAWKAINDKQKILFRRSKFTSSSPSITVHLKNLPVRITGCLTLHLKSSISPSYSEHPESWESCREQNRQHFSYLKLNNYSSLLIDSSFHNHRFKRTLSSYLQISIKYAILRQVYSHLIGQELQFVKL